MEKPSPLFKLIKSLSKAEKRHFKVLATTAKKDSNTVRLFDAIDKQVVYDEAAIKQQFKDQSFTKQLHVTKNYLYQLILKSLRNYHFQLSVDAELKDMLRDVEILFRRDLVEQCWVILTKAEQIAHAHEKQTMLLDIFAWQRKLQLVQHAAHEVMDELNLIYANECQCLENIKHLAEYWSLAVNIFHKNSGNSDWFCNNPLMQAATSAKTVQAKTMFYHVKFADNYIRGDMQAANEAVSNLVALLEAHPQFIRDDPSGYITAVNNKISLLLNHKNVADIPPLLAKIKTLPDRYQLSRKTPVMTKQLLRTYNVELELYRDTQQIANGIALVDELNAFLVQYQSAIPNDYRLLFYYQFAYLYFMHDDYTQALMWLNTIAKAKFGIVREDIQSFAKLLTLIIHFELGHISILKYSVDSVRRFLKNKRKLEQYETLLLNFFSHLSTSLPVQYPALFDKLSADLFTPPDTQVTDDVLDSLDFKQWLNKKRNQYSL